MGRRHRSHSTSSARPDARTEPGQASVLAAVEGARKAGRWPPLTFVARAARPEEDRAHKMDDIPPDIGPSRHADNFLFESDAAEGATRFQNLWPGQSIREG